MLAQIFNNPDFTNLQIIFYFLGAFGWWASYILVIRKILKDKWVEFPAFIIAANVAWEFLWGFVFDLSFGGIFLQYVWRGGFIMDAFMLYAVFKYGKSQYKTDFIRRNYYSLVASAFVFFFLLIYFYVRHGYDLAMGFNSGMILNLMHSIGCLLLFWDHPKRNFSVAIGVTRFLGTNVFLFLYMLMYRVPQYFTITLLVMTFIIDFYYITQVYKRNKQMAVA